MGKFSRDKGKRGERATANELKAAYPWLPDIKRGLQSRGGGAEVPDVVGVPGLHIEVKTGKCPNPRAALKQAKKDCAAVTYPVAVIRDNRCEPFIVMDFRDFREVIKPWLEGQKLWDSTASTIEQQVGAQAKHPRQQEVTERPLCSNDKNAKSQK